MHSTQVPRLTAAPLLAGLLLCSASARAEPDHHEHEDEAHEREGHDHTFEFATSAGAAYLTGEQAFAFGLHLHGMFALGESPWGLGLGYERIFDEHAHNTIGPVVQYRLTHQWSVNLSPGVTFGDEHPDEIDPALHVETAYEWQLGRFHLGPSIEAAFDPHDAHFTLGAHVGFGL